MKTKLKSHTETDEIERIPIQRNELMNEIDLIDHVYETILKNGFTFSREQVINYYLSLKTKPFVILTGISGTGKTKITELFAQAVCKEFKNQYLLLPVRPDWNDDRNLIGYNNPLTKQYQTTPFLDFILKAALDPENPYFVCLDEMNLARVEYYFSTFLSAMESGSKEISLPGYGTIKTGDGKEMLDKIIIPLNLFFTGTVNMDETTYRFSPKVLDRANTIEFNEIKLKTRRVPEGTLAIKPELIEPFKTYFLNDKVRKNGTSSEYTKWETENWDEQVGFLNSVNEALEKFNLHFGYRIRDEVLRYMYFAEIMNSDDFTPNKARDFQIKQKILPRIKGTDSIKKALELLQVIIQEYEQSTNKLDQMNKALDKNGYTDFYQ
ncbi:MAG: AAA family ATPase [Candidatus Methanoperedens sp.]